MGLAALRRGGGAPVTLLEPELATYARHLPQLLMSDPGRFVLVHDHEILSIFDTQFQAITAGYERLGNVPFLVKQIVAVETPIQLATPMLDI
jgi:hypothetical protein